MPGRLPYILLAALLITCVFMIVPALADQTYELNKDFKRVNSNIVIHLLNVTVTDEYMGNVYPSQSPEETRWAHLFYRYENTGDTTETGNIQYGFIDSNGNEYDLNPEEYTGVVVQPHSTSDLRFNEIPIPRGTVLTKVRVYEGANPNFLLKEETYDIKPVNFSASATSSGPASVSPSVANYVCCLPMLPFAIIAGMGLVGLYVRGRGVRK